MKPTRHFTLLHLVTTGRHIRMVQVCLLLAGLLANGVEWDILQVIAWTRMTMSYAHTMPLGEALKTTFSPSASCSLCKIAARARQHQHGALPSDEKLREKQLLVFQPVPKLLAAVPVAVPLTPDDFDPVSVEKPAPPVPPPRVLV